MAKECFDTSDVEKTYCLDEARELAKKFLQ